MQVVVERELAVEPGICFLTIYLPMDCERRHASTLGKHFCRTACRGKENELLSKAVERAYHGTGKGSLASTRRATHNHYGSALPVGKEAPKGAEGSELVGGGTVGEGSQYGINKLSYAHRNGLNNRPTMLLFLSIALPERATATLGEH